MASFRDWLIERIRLTKYATIAIADEKIDAVAARLGVQPDVLLTARAQTRMLLAERGFARHERCRQVNLLMPEPVWKAWKAECDYRSVQGSALLRSLIHAYLIGNWEPVAPLEKWRIRGHTYLADRTERGHTREQAMVPIGAIRAMASRAKKIGSKAHSIYRSLVVEVLEGGFHEVRIIDAKQMYDDETRYFAEAEANMGSGVVALGK